MRFKQNEVHFSNPQLSPGFKMHSWSSQNDFVDGALWENLPLLKSGTEYQVVIDAQIKPANSVHIQLDFFDESNELIDEQIFADQNFRFTVPMHTKRYQISLVSLNNQEMIFKNMTINPTFNDFEITVQTSGTKRVIIKPLNGKARTIEIILRDRFLESGSYIGANNQLTVYFEYNGRHKYSVETLSTECWQALQDVVLDWDAYDVQVKTIGVSSQLLMALQGEIAKKLMKKGEH
ncbi:asp3 protein [Pediococcus claussenii]|nr:asp3 protein [Pediococcus claussenii]